MPLVTVRYFAGMKEKAGTDSESLDLEGGDAAAILASLAKARPDLGQWCASSRIAVGDRFVQGPVELQAGDEVAVIPPVSGG
jgi:molybdopterin converting factor subunit 1